MIFNKISIFVQFSLHISKIFSNFAADFIEKADKMVCFCVEKADKIMCFCVEKADKIYVTV